MRLEQLAERAVIGGLLREPERFADVREWLEVDDFDGTSERIVYAAIVAVNESGQSATPELVNQAVLKHQPRPLEPADGAFLVECMQACPSAARAALYGRMVLESSIRRRIASQAAGLGQEAEQARTRDDLNRVFFRVDRVRREIERLHAREAKASKSQAPSPVLPEHLDPLPRSRLHHDSETELTAVRALVERPAAIGAVARWLSPDDFADWDCRVIYGQLLEMDQARRPIDLLTVGWRIAQLGLSDREVAALTARPATPAAALVDPVTASRQVLERSVQSTVVDTAREVERAARERPRDNLTGEGHTRLNALWPGQRRLVASSPRMPSF